MGDEEAAELAIAMARGARALAQPEVAPARRHHVAERVAATGRRAGRTARQRSAQLYRHRVAARSGPARTGPEQVAAARAHLYDDALDRAADRVHRHVEAALLRAARLRAERRDPEERPCGAAEHHRRHARARRERKRRTLRARRLRHEPRAQLAGLARAERR